MEQATFPETASGEAGEGDSEQLRQAGNGAFRKGEHDKALALYSDALASADLNSPTRHLILGNRWVQSKQLLALCWENCFPLLSTRSWSRHCFSYHSRHCSEHLNNLMLKAT